MAGTVVALPATGDASQWTETEKALVEAAGLVTGPANNKQLAPRPVVEAFLLHARRTGLDPIARQIYCIERGGKWGTQVSIDGARLVAERTKEYRGQTPTQWTSDGITWVDVWLASENPKAARVGVHREGFIEPLFAVATWDAYSANSPMWRKMGALMLGKCAEMLALRKAFPQDLSGLYSTEEMDQAGQPKQAAQVPSHAALVEAETYGRDWVAEARTKASTEEINALWAEVPAHERSKELLDSLRAVGVALAQQVAAESVPPSPEPEKPWAAQGEASGSEWATRPIPQGEAVRPGEEETPPLEGMEQGEPETGGGDRG
ncbi:recombinase RecT [Frigoribacterium sp. CFBP9030]|uniref:recombinase RecT n=1 Tax=Frigoribacterium sp. CFBP9030 TaxID=3096537 RepID=UPI002A6B00A8|nr:recombinase RecT [Frigoribacterium sp. CFBP9030]MDY0891847.1 recombinase RecT [Frigoribacterium sp. CFBP9030]